MNRVTTSFLKARRHKKVLKQSKGYYNRANRCFKIAARLIDHGKEYQFHARKQNKTIFRQKFIAIINTACRQLFNINYSRFIHYFNNHELCNYYDRKTLALIIQHDLSQFKHIGNTVLPK